MIYDIIWEKDEGYPMTAKMDSSFIDYFDFIEIAQEALESAPRKLFEKMMHIVINKLHHQEIELQKSALEIDEMHTLPVDDLDEFYDNILETIEDIKLFKKRLEQIREKDTLFEDLYIEADRLHTSLVTYMDRVGQLEVRLLQENQKSA